MSPNTNTNRPLWSPCWASGINWRDTVGHRLGETEHYRLISDYGNSGIWVSPLSINIMFNPISYLKDHGTPLVLASRSWNTLQVFTSELDLLYLLKPLLTWLYGQFSNICAYFLDVLSRGATNNHIRSNYPEGFQNQRICIWIESLPRSVSASSGEYRTVEDRDAPYRELELRWSTDNSAIWSRCVLDYLQAVAWDNMASRHILITVLEASIGKSSHLIPILRF